MLRVTTLVPPGIAAYKLIDLVSSAVADSSVEILAYAAGLHKQAPHLFILAPLDAIHKADLVIAFPYIDANPDWLSASAEVCFHIGCAVGMNKPVVVIAPERAWLPNELEQGSVLRFGSDAELRALKQDLVPLLEKGDRHPNEMVLAITLAKRPHKVFVCYAHEDEPFHELLRKELRELEDAGIIEVWSDALIEATDDWEHRIDRALASARVAIVLVTEALLASQFVERKELPRLLDRTDDGLRILPLVVDRGAFEQLSNMARFQALSNVPGLRNASEEELRQVFKDLRARLMALSSEFESL